MARDQYLVKLPRRFGGVRQLECFSDEISHRRRLPVCVDMRGVTFIRPLGVVATVMFIQEMEQRNRPMIVEFPNNVGVLNYLLQIGLPAMMNELGSWKWPADFPQEATPKLRPMITLRRFRTADDVEQIAQEMTETFVDADVSSLLSPCHVIFSELADNVITHSLSTGFVLAQRYEYAEGPVIDIAVGDCGVGIRAALWKNRQLRPNITDDKSALVMAMEDGVSGIADPHRGYGLGHVTRELTARDRRLTIRSQGASGYWEEGRRTEVYACGGSVGTLVHAFIPC